MAEMTEVQMERCGRPAAETLAGLEEPYRPFAEGNGWYAHFFYRQDGSPAFKRVTHGDHDELWYSVRSSAFDVTHLD